MMHFGSFSDELLIIRNWWLMVHEFLKKTLLLLVINYYKT